MIQNWMFCEPKKRVSRLVCSGYSRSIHIAMDYAYSERQIILTTPKDILCWKEFKVPRKSGSEKLLCHGYAWRSLSKDSLLRIIPSPFAVNGNAERDAFSQGVDVLSNSLRTKIFRFAPTFKPQPSMCPIQRSSPKGSLVHASQITWTTAFHTLLG